MYWRAIQTNICPAERPRCAHESADNFSHTLVGYVLRGTRARMICLASAEMKKKVNVCEFIHLELS